MEDFFQVLIENEFQNCPRIVWRWGALTITQFWLIFILTPNKLTTLVYSACLILQLRQNVCGGEETRKKEKLPLYCSSWPLTPEHLFDLLLYSGSLSLFVNVERYRFHFSWGCVHVVHSQMEVVTLKDIFGKNGVTHGFQTCIWKHEFWISENLEKTNK